MTTKPTQTAETWMTSADMQDEIGHSEIGAGLKAVQGAISEAESCETIEDVRANLEAAAEAARELLKAIDETLAEISDKGQDHATKALRAAASK